jgi:hypothetical protein
MQIMVDPLSVEGESFNLLLRFSVLRNYDHPRDHATFWDMTRHC